MNEYQYDYQTVKGFIVSCLFWGVIGLVIGLLISAQMWNANLNFGEYFSFGRLRTVHTNVLAYGLGIGAEFGIFYYLVIRLTKRPLLFPKLARFHLWLFNIGIALAAWTLFMGYSQNLEYAEFEWPIDIAVVILWVIFAINVMGTIFKRKEEEMYISLWYIIATIVTVAILYIVNNLSIPATLFKSYHLFAGVNSANVEWWYGHNAVGFLFTTPILAMFYYFLPKSTGLPIYSHRLSIISFWSLIFAYLWTGAHHLVYTPLPDWIQTLGIAFTLFLIAPSWGSVVNGYFTVESDWSVMKNKYLTKFFIAGITFYGLQTIQGPSQGIRVISSLIHYTDWVPGHVHMGTMGWVTMVICASIYYIIPHIYKTEIYSVKLANIHFWIVLIGQLMFSITMWITGIQQGAMWKMTNPDGSLKYTFIETVTANYPYWQMRTVAGIIFVIGMLFFLYNVFMTIQKGKKELAAKLAAANA
ncbi:cbb3-type cytochrome c oxidase subunit I [Calditerrivibrio nitroreducens]|uniref:Cytochrome-c oxidase n=1 Tax=Calditerrivibrio nitroreducens (strain DSM 19672 / NBRC 101217 / Yu37-1) TaxID=768670 RepID=E4TGW9_CALNY|nr:cbb3-type cytochrome c oxidase subunit I [Calditerrivibrio nitroreducens]ADR18729.1 Cytochrome-c oxidase [Calditerrivibrio nitroreducens DSM 19672]